MDRDERAARERRYMLGAIAQSYVPRGLAPWSQAMRRVQREQWRAMSPRQRRVVITVHALTLAVYGTGVGLVFTGHWTVVGYAGLGVAFLLAALGVVAPVLAIRQYRRDRRATKGDDRRQR